LEGSAKEAQEKAKGVKEQFNAYTKQIMELHQVLNKVDEHRLEYATELFNHFKNTEIQRLRPMLADYQPLAKDRYDIHKDDAKFEELFDKKNPDAKETIKELEGGAGKD